MSSEKSILDVVSKAESDLSLRRKQEEELERFKERFFDSIDFNEKTSTLYYEPESDHSLPCVRLYTDAVNDEPFLSIKANVQIKVAGNKRVLKLFNIPVEEESRQGVEKNLYKKEDDLFKKRKEEFSDLSLLLTKKIAGTYNMDVIIYYRGTSTTRSYTLLAQDDRDRIEVAFTKY